MDDAVDVAVFIGPSLDPAQAARILPAEYLPPVQRGDIDALLARERPPTYIGVVDGRFLQALSLSPKEVLRAMDRRVKVFGSSSMGALRAAELWTMGMVGVGRVFEMYRSGAVDADDEVAITFDPETLRATCVPMVNIRVAAAAAVERSVVGAATAAAMVDTAKAMYFPDRSYANVLRLLSGTAPAEELDRLRAFLAGDAPDAKGEDALLLLETIRDALARDRTAATV